MKNNKNLKIKILLTLIVLIMLSVITYISLPYISYALENEGGVILENVEKISIPSNFITMNQKQIHEHRGWDVVANDSATEVKTYNEAVGKTGISDINTYINIIKGVFVEVVNYVYLALVYCCILFSTQYIFMSVLQFNGYYYSRFIRARVDSFKSNILVYVLLVVLYVLVIILNIICFCLFDSVIPRRFNSHFSTLGQITEPSTC